MKWLILFFLFFFISCALTPKRPLDKEFVKNNHGQEMHLLNQYLKNACLSGQGYGLFKIDHNVHKFNFESEYQETPKKWIFALSVPLRGEELIEITWPINKKLEQQVHFMGASFLEFKKLIEEMDDILELILKFKKQPKELINKICQNQDVPLESYYFKGTCQINKKSNEGTNSIDWKLTSNHLKLYYKKIKITLQQYHKNEYAGKLKFRQGPVKVALNFRQCEFP